MSDIVYLYPKTSCPCDTCLPSYPIKKDGVKSNLAYRGCSTPDYFSCYDRVELKREIQPQNKQGIYQLNPQVYTDKLAQGFDKVRCKNGCPIAPSCPEDVYLSRDPRQFEAVRAMYMALDTIPTDGDVRLKDIYSKKYENYGQGYEEYKDIRDGQIYYYIDKSIEDAFYYPVYSEPSIETANLFQDPMGSMKPEYNRTPLINTENPTTTTPYRENRGSGYPGCLSWITDSQSFRNDLYALQQRKNNQSKYSARWANMNE